MPDNAKFCGKCGAVAPSPGKTPAALIKAHREVKKYKIISIVLAGLCVLMGIGWAVTAHDPMRSAENYERDAAGIERAGIELSGTFVVGEDEELPAGRYNIYPPDGESYLSVDIFANMEDAKVKYDEEYKSLAVDQIYRAMRGYKLKEGQVVVVEYDSAYFELVSEQPEDSGEVTGGSDADEDASVETNADSDNNGDGETDTE